MGMFASSHIYEDGLNIIPSSARFIIITTTQPKNMSTAIDNALAWTTAVASTDFTITANTSGYHLQVSTDADIISATTLESTGKAGHISIGSSDELFYVTTCTTKNLGPGDTVTMPSWSIWIKQPTA
jgi:hypothetical protein